ncbi:hypothetical protein, partial [Streptomyces sp. NPDC057616]|uniref:hypothetical protein n=1 Tax=Streptomyces sp. NPDC057616 TaxID=3346183 RepID=UPI0036CB0872
MRELNEDAAAYTGQRTAAESIERGGGGLGVSDLLARVTAAATAAGNGAAATPTRDVNSVAETIA